ncbi:MAG: glycerophosphodiester phosphodiesterase [Chloroflexota bacterium]
MPSVKKIAHRGASGKYPENTRLAFVKAIEMGVDMIELDCQLTEDGHVVVFHDERLRRTAGARGTVRSKTLAQLKALDIGQWKKKSYRGERILTLEEALEILAGDVDLCLEIKSYPESPPGIEIKILFILSHYDYLHRSILSSFDYRSLGRVRELAPEAALGVICGSRIQEDALAAAKQLEAKSVHLQKTLASRDFLNLAWEEGLDVYVWTVNEAREMQALIALGVQGIISDFPEKFRKLQQR